jgi:hypothetical protein
MSTRAVVHMAEKMRVFVNRENRKPSPVTYCYFSDSVLTYSRNLLLWPSLQANCDGFAQSIKLWSQKTPLLGTRVQTNTRPNIQERCFLCGSPRECC